MMIMTLQTIIPFQMKIIGLDALEHNSFLVSLRLTEIRKKESKTGKRPKKET